MEERWSAAVALLAAGGLGLAVAPNLSLGPIYLPLSILLILEVMAIACFQTGHRHISHWLGHVASGTLTFFMVISVGFLVSAVVHRVGSPAVLLRSAAALWATNIVVFASWYWRLDAGGPYKRLQTPGHQEGSFFFPQMALPDTMKKSMNIDAWEPGFIDYLFLAFNTSTALSPADTGALSRWSKVLMMIQSIISLTVIVILAARAVNML